MRLQMIDTPKPNSHIFFGESIEEVKKLSDELEEEEQEILEREAENVGDIK